mgnify:CR=1 FL=1
MLQTQNTYLRLVNVDDAEFILSLRQNQNLNQFLSAVSPDIQMQRDWIISYKLREEQGLDYYFIVMDKRFEDVGMVRVYDINYENKSFTWGSWVLSENRPKYTALDSMILSYDFAFNELGLDLCQFKVHTANKRAKLAREPLLSNNVSFGSTFKQTLVEGCLSAFSRIECCSFEIVFFFF